MAGTRCRVWRAAFQPLRDAATASAALHSKQQQVQSWELKKVVVLQELVAQSPALSAAAGDVPPQEIVGDLTLLVQMVMTEGHCQGNINSIYLRVCRLVNDINSRTRLEFTTSTLLPFSHFLRQMLELSHFPSARRGRSQEHSGYLADAGEPDLGIEALRALVKFIHENGSHLPVEEVTALIDKLLPFISYQNNEVGSGMFGMGNSTVEAPQSGSRILIVEQKECQRLAFLAIGNLFPRAGAMISKDTWHRLLQAFHKNLDNLPLNMQPLENAAASRYYAAVLRCLHLVLTDAKWSLEEHVTAFVASLRMFFTYGLANNQFLHVISKSPAYGGGNVEEHPKTTPSIKVKSNSLYRPPHLRGNLRSATSGGRSDEANVEAGGFILSSDSEQSDSDGPNDSDNSKFSRIRINAILSIQAIARADPKSLHAHWSSLFPMHDVLHPRPRQATLLTALLFDPISKARLAAASTVAALLEGPSRAFLQVAEYREVSRAGSFTTLSSSLGQTLIQLHTGLVYLISNESHCGTYMAALKALSLLVSATPFERLPSELLRNVLLSIQKRAHQLLPVSCDRVNMLVASINGLGTCLNVVPTCPQVANFLLSNLRTEQRLMDSTRGGSLFLDLVSYARVQATPVISIEAFQALKAAVHNYSPVLFGYWDEVSSSVFEAVKGTIGTSAFGDIVGSPLPSKDSLAVMCSTQGKTFDEKVVHSALKLLDEFLRAMSGFQGTDETANDIPLHPPSPSELPVPLKILPSSSIIQEGTRKEVSYEVRGSMHWMEALKKHLPEALVSFSPMVRGAALTCFAGLTSWVFSSLPAAQQDYILSTVVNAATRDETPSVRSAACRAIGVLVGFSEVIGRKQRVSTAVDVVTSASFDTSLLVRITASWALANTCDALCRGFSTADFAIMSENSILGSLVNCALGAAKDGDKVRANAVRALGNIAKFVNFNCACETVYPSFGSDTNHKNVFCSSTTLSSSIISLRELVETLMSCIQIGNVKVQWNVCHALGNLFQNQTIHLQEMPWTYSIYKALLVLVQDSANFKIRIHAASALGVPTKRTHYGEAYGDVLHGLLRALESCECNPTAPSKLKYQVALIDQLTSTTLHVLSISLPVDYIPLKDFLNELRHFR
ncbi:hypothetical protein O6H91_17G080600 [Diphasiastrum complanatum]|uniref:Uncharacterized protein n=1 Tax=Diphasiastrum complanatum TaxID=34168 RepID=A0ACC2B8J9_DIPCM|nr:hypothetical protein O6H91_17G080600 [Diphasiastrum complanatum]